MSAAVTAAGLAGTGSQQPQEPPPQVKEKVLDSMKYPSPPLTSQSCARAQGKLVPGADAGFNPIYGSAGAQRFCWEPQSPGNQKETMP